MVPGAASDPASADLCRFAVVPERSSIVVAARSTVGPINWTASGPVGEVTCRVVDGHLDLSAPTSGHVTLEVGRLTSGNAVYDAELARRIDARRFPTTTVSLLGARSLGDGRADLRACLDIHGVTADVEGVVTAELFDSDRLVVTGEKVIDIRDFDIPAPQMLMLKIYPAVRVHLFIEATKAHNAA